MWQEFLALLRLIGRALALDPHALDTDPADTWTLLADLTAIVALSLLLGGAVVLVINRVNLDAAVFLLFLTALAVVFERAVEAGILWLLCAISVGPPPFWLVAQAVLLSMAPLVFGFLEIAPWIGPLILRLLNVWSLLVLWALVHGALGVGSWSALALAGIAWLATRLLRAWSAPRLRVLYSGLWTRATGRPLYETAGELLLRRESEVVQR